VILEHLDPRANARLAVELDPASGVDPEALTGEACIACRRQLTVFEAALARAAGGVLWCESCRLDRRPGPAQGAGDASRAVTAAEAKSLPSPAPAATWCSTVPAERDGLLGDLVPRGARVHVVGESGAGKTTACYRMVRAILTGEEFLGIKGAGEGPALIIDLEQGRRSILRGLQEAGLAGRDDLYIAHVPDGLALDRDEQDLAWLDGCLAELRPAVVAIDPYYKAHAVDEPNAERPIVELMRLLDGLRAKHGCAMLIPAHARKGQPGASGATRKLTLDDVAGSGAITRGAEVVLGIERVAAGYARLRFIKDRDGDLPVGEAWGLIFSREEGYRRDPRELEPERDLLAELRAWQDEEWRTDREWAKELSARKTLVRAALDELTEAGDMEFMVGPPGRHKTAHCWRRRWSREPGPGRDHLHAEGLLRGGPAVPIGTRDSGTTSSPAASSGTTSGQPAPSHEEGIPW